MSKKKRNNPFLEDRILSVEPARFPTLTPWMWDLEKIVPGVKVLDFTPLADKPQLFRPILSALWVLYIECIPQKSSSYIKKSRLNILKFAHYLKQHEKKEIRELSKLSELSREILVDYRAWTNENYSSGPAHDLYMMVKRVLALLQSERSPVPGCLSENLEIPVRTLKSKQYDATSTQPYNRDEEEAIIKACKQEMNEVLERLAEGNKLLALGVDPRLVVNVRPSWPPNLVFTEGWYSKANLLWYVKHVLNGRLPSQNNRSELYTRFYSNPRPELPFRRTADPFKVLYPQVRDLIPFIILLSLRTGLNADSILSLRRNCIVGVEGGRSIIQYTKGRGSHELMTRAFSNKGATSPTGIIRTVLQMTDCLVQLAEEHNKNELWLAFHVNRYSVDGFSSSINAINLRLFYPYTNGYDDRAGFFKKHNLKDQHGNYLRFSFKEARVTHATNAYLKRGNLEWVSRKKMKHHGREGMNTTALHYVANEATRHIHDQTIRNAQDGLVNEVLRNVIVDGGSTKMDVKAVAKHLSESEEKVTAILAGAQDVFIAQCRDFYNKPGDTPNSPCSDPWQCFGCANALWTSRILPRLIKFLWFMEEQSKFLSPEDWERKFSFPFAAITKDILPRFQTRTIEWARAEAKELPFYVSPHLKEI